jgi:hypothetical protein
MNTGIRYHEALVRDLYWALSSVPLLERSDAGIHWAGCDWCSDIGQAFAHRLAALDDNPQPLRDAVSGQKDLRLGNYFETLWQFWLAGNDRYRLLYANLPVRSPDRTLGEFDLLVKDSETGDTLHWELAVKFYLGVGDTAQPANWWGPAQRDRLDIKTARLVEHQSRLSQHPHAGVLLQQLGIRIDATWVILKGRLFYPLGASATPPHGAHPAHERGFWVTAGAFSALEQALWLPLQRRQWLAPVSHVEPVHCVESSALVARWRDRPLRYPLCVARIVNGTETERGFVVPDEWLQGTGR